MRPRLRVRSYDLELLGERGQEISYGELAHQALYLLAPLPRGARRLTVTQLVEKAVRQALALSDPRFREDFDQVASFLTKILVRALLLPEVRPFFEKGVKAFRELEIQDESGELHRLDRLVITSQGPVILEFKLGTRRRSHWEQIRLYQRLVEEIFGLKPKAFLFYLEEPVLLEVGKPAPGVLF